MQDSIAKVIGLYSHISQQIHTNFNSRLSNILLMLALLLLQAPLLAAVSPGVSLNGSFTITAPSKYSYFTNFMSISGPYVSMQSHWWSNTTRTVSNAPNGIYSYRAYYCDTWNCNEDSTSIPVGSVVVVRTPGTPGGITFSPSSLSCNSSPTVRWGAASGGNRYQILQRQRLAGGAWSLWTSLSSNHSSTIITPNNLAPGYTYQYAVRARYLLKHNGRDNYSNWGSYRYSAEIRKPHCAPGAPPTVAVSTATPTTTGSYTVSWGAANGQVEQYELQEQLNHSGYWVIRDTLSASQRQKTYSHQARGTHCYRVKARNTDSGTYSYDEPCVTVTYPQPGAPSAPTFSTDTPLSNNDFTVSWPAATGVVEEYELQQQFNGGSWQVLQSSSTQNRILNHATAGNYCYRVYARNADKTSAASSAACVTVKVPKPVVSLLVGPPSPSTSYDALSSYNSGFHGAYSIEWSVSGQGLISQSLLINGVPTALNNASGTRDYDHDDNLSSGDITHTYQVRACNAEICTDSQLLSVTVKAFPRPSQPGNFLSNLASSDSRSYTLTWNRPAETTTTAYIIERNGVSQRIEGADNQSVSYQGDFGQTYSHRIQACANQTGTDYCSGFTANHQVYIQQATPSVPSNIQVLQAPDIDNPRTLQLGWSAASGVIDHYVLEQQCASDNQWQNLQTAKQLQATTTVADYGVCDYRVKACNADNCSAYSATASIDISEPTVLPPQQAVDPANDNMPEAIYWGDLNGSQSVSPSGAFTYNLPIAVPPGINGMQPELSLAYNSNRRNGLVGWGWAINGLPSIHRCPANLAADGYKSGIRHGENYKYCLNGQRLVQVSSNEYRTETESFTKIIAAGAVGNDPAYWTLYYKDGKVAQYGATEDAKRRETQNSGIYRWHLNRKQDVAGNYLDVAYHNNSAAGTHRPDAIDYTQHDSAQGSNHRVQFHYQSRPDSTKKYIAESLNTLDQRLSRITVSTNNTTVRYYDLSYQQTGQSYFGKTFADPTQTSRLDNIVLCANANACTRPLTFDWSSAETSQYTFDSSATIKPAANERSTSIRGDFDGDGQQEVMYRGSDGHVYMREHNQAQGELWYSCAGNNCENWLWPEPGVLLTNQPLGQRVLNKPLDMNGDGYMDIVTMAKQYSRIYVALSNGTSLAAPVEWGATILNRYNQGTLVAESSKLVDLNGDALPDIVHFEALQTTIEVRLNNGSGFGARQVWTSGETLYFAKRHTTADGNWQWLPLNFVDFNGDGLTDIWTCDQYGYGTDKCSIIVALNTGNNSFAEPVYWSDPIRLAHKKFGDVNGDGFIDYIDLNLDGNVYVSLSDGTRFLPVQNWTGSGADIQACKGSQTNYDVLTLPKNCISGGGLTYGGNYTQQLATVLADVNGDGCADILSTGGEKHPLYQLEKWLEGIYVSFSYCAVNTQQNRGFSPVMQMLDRPAPGLWSTDIVHAVTHNKRYGFAGPEPLLNLDGQGLPDLRHGTSNIQAPRVIGLVSGEQQRSDINYSSIANPDVHTHEDLSVVDYLASDVNNVIELENDLYASQSSRPVNVVKTLQQPNGIGGQQRIDYHYTGYKRHKRGYGSLGFSRIEQTTHDSEDKQLRVINDYSQVIGNDYKLIGRPLRTRQYALNAQQNWQLMDNRYYDWAVRIYRDSLHGDLHYFPYIKQQSSQRWDLDGSPIADSLTINSETSGVPNCTPLSAANIHTLDAGSFEDSDYSPEGVLYRSQTVTCDHSAASSATQVKVSANSDIQNLDSPWVRGLVHRQTESAWVGDSLGSMVLESRTQAMSYNSLGQLHNQTTEPDAADDSPLKLTTTMHYNVYGSVERIVESWGNQPNNGLNFNSRTTHINESYNSLGERTVTTTDAANLRSSTEYDAAFGQPVHDTDANGLVTEQHYDVFGRLNRIVNPDSSEQQLDYRRCNNCFSYNDNAIAYIQSKSTGSSASRDYLDSQGRSVGTRSRNLNGRFIYSYQHYDAAGNIEQSSAPFFASDSAPITQTRYDSLGRATRTTRPDNTIVSTDYSGATTTRQTTFTQAGNTVTQTQVHVHNAANWPVRSVDNAGTAVVFDYWPFGELKSTEVNGDSRTRTSLHYDKLGRKTYLYDPNTGNNDYRYNALGLLISETDGNGIQTGYHYDALERTTQRIDNATAPGAAIRTHTWVYDSQPHGKGQLASLSGYNTDGSAYQESYDYNSLSLLEHKHTTLDGETYTSSSYYDNFSRIAYQYYPSDYAIAHIYNDYGHLQSLASAGGKHLWSANDANARGQLTAYTQGNQMSTERVYQPNTGYISRIHTYKDTFTIQDHAYTFDGIGNLTQRQDHFNGVTESFCYDNMNRLVSARFTGCSSTDSDNQYDALGNLTTKAGVSSDMQYGNGAGPHALTQVDNLDYHYDASGNLISVTQGNSVIQTVHYSAYNKPTRMSKGSNWSEIIYGPHKNRVKRIDNSGRTTRYIDGIYETVNGSTDQQIHYISDSALYIQSNSQNHYRYLHRDHIGSVVAQSDEQVSSSTDITWLANGPWGERRDESWDGNQQGTDYQPENSARGYTDHEHLDGVGLIHMNGRVYDPQIGRFLSPDILIQAPLNSQSYNRYSYVWNNPLSFVDPSGYQVQSNGGDCGGCPEVPATAPSPGGGGGLSLPSFFDGGSGGFDFDQGGYESQLGQSLDFFIDTVYAADNKAINKHFGRGRIGQMNARAFKRNLRRQANRARQKVPQMANALASKGQSFGFKTNVNGDLIICIGTSACSASSNVGNASSSRVITEVISSIPLLRLFRMGNSFRKGLGNNPFKGKTPEKIDKMFRKKGFDAKGPNPQQGKGTYINPKTSRSYHIDANHPPPKPPHVGVGRPRGKRDLNLPRSRDYDL